MSSIDVVIPMYNPGANIIATLESVLEQILEPDLVCNVYVVDDGSRDGSAVQIASTFGNKVDIISLQQNLGRSGARNRGADAGTGAYILLLDSDCIFKDKNCIAAHVVNLQSGKDVSFGTVRGMGDGFWQTYQDQINRGRVRKALAGDYMAMTSATFAVRREVFEKVGGFDERYKEYGFEDRDLFARLMKSKAKMGLASDAVVWHSADLSLESIAHKMEKAGRYTSGIFMKDHPEEYTWMGFSKFDVRRHPILLTVPAALSRYCISLGDGLASVLFDLISPPTL